MGVAQGDSRILRLALALQRSLFPAVRQQRGGAEAVIHLRKARTGSQRRPLRKRNGRAVQGTAADLRRNAKLHVPAPFPAAQSRCSRPMTGIAVRTPGCLARNPLAAAIAWRCVHTSSGLRL